MLWKRLRYCFAGAVAAAIASAVCAQGPDPGFLNHRHTVLDAHNCYPYDGRWNDRLQRALDSGFPVAIEQDLAWYVDPVTKQGRVVVSHTPNPAGTEPTLRDYFFEQVRPVVEKAIAENNRKQWPLIVLHFDFKDNQPAILHAVWNLLGEYQPWLSTAAKSRDVRAMTAIERRPILVITEDSDAQQKVFYDDVPVGGRLLLFGSAHTHPIPRGMAMKEVMRWAVTLPPAELLSERPTTYRRWWNSSWYPVEEGGQSRAGDWTEADEARLRALVDHAHKLGYWIRFYTLDGFQPGQDQGWGSYYNFGSRDQVVRRWKAAIAAGVDLLATDQYEELAPYLDQDGKSLRPSAGKTESVR